jgi:deazaflavin-dependent oxidoreductase (nitroreductase family)
MDATKEKEPVARSQEENLRQALKYMSRLHVGMWRLGLGPWFGLRPDWWSWIMVLTHTGRKSGLMHRTAVNYAMVDGEIYVVSGFGSGSDWYRNILKNPQVEVWLPEGWWCGLVEDVSDSPQRLRLVREVIIASAFVGLLAGLDAHAMTDEELDRMTSKYHLLHIKRMEALTGPGGPGDLAWVWPLSTMVLLTMALSRRRR